MKVYKWIFLFFWLPLMSECTSSPDFIDLFYVWPWCSDEVIWNAQKSCSDNEGRDAARVRGQRSGVGEQE